MRRTLPPALPRIPCPSRAWDLLLRDELFEELHGARITRLPEPEHRLAPHLAILVVLRDVHELVDRLAVTTALREHEDQLLLDLRVRHLVVQRCERLRRGAAILTRPEQRLLTHLRALLRIQRDVHDPLAVAESALLREREDDLLLERVLLHAAIQPLQVVRVLLR